MLADRDRRSEFVRTPQAAAGGRFERRRSFGQPRELRGGSGVASRGLGDACAWLLELCLALSQSLEMEIDVML